MRGKKVSIPLFLLFSRQVVEKELQIQDREKMYIELKQVMQRQPGPEVAEQLHIYQHTLKEKTKQLKASVTIIYECMYIYVIIRAWHQS